MSILIFVSIILYIISIVFLITGLFKHNLLPVSSYDTLPSVSIIIAARNEEEYIGNLIEDLVSQEYPVDKLEIIIVNDRSEDETLSIINTAIENYAFIKTVNIKDIPDNLSPKKNALTHGIEKSSGEIILLTDADCRVGKLWTASMAYSVVRQDCITIGFSQVQNEFGTLFEEFQRIDFMGIVFSNAGAAGWEQFWSGTGQNLAFYKRDFFSIEGFTKVNDRVSGDDMYLVQEISRIKGGYIQLDPNSFVKTSSMRTLKGFLNQRIRWSSNAKINFRKAPLFFGFLSIVLIYNSLILLFALLMKPWIVMFCIKLFFDGLVIFLGCKLFSVKTSVIGYLVWAILQPIYIPVIGLLGLRGKYTWKT
tara:strand:+ start:8440 stop:9531 length:1092 start_codon:yes stop_codon:yes gene_type:complete